MPRLFSPPWALITTISHSLQVSELDNAGTTATAKPFVRPQFDYSLAFLPIHHCPAWERLDTDPAGWICLGGCGGFGSLPVFSPCKTRVRHCFMQPPLKPLRSVLLCFREACGFYKMKNTHFTGWRERKRKKSDEMTRNAAAVAHHPVLAVAAALLRYLTRLGMETDPWQPRVEQANIPWPDI